MEDLVKKLQADHGISAEQSHGILNTIKDFVKQKFPMLDSTIDSLFGTAVVDPAAPVVAVDATKPAEHSMMDKISDVIPGQTGEKIEEFAKGAAHKAEEVFDSLKDKIGGMFGGDKK